MRDFKSLKEELLKDKATAREYYRLEPRYKMISQVISARNRKKITQKDLAVKIGTKQSAIARLESGNVNPSFDFLNKIAEVLGYRLEVRFN